MGFSPNSEGCLDLVQCRCHSKGTKYPNRYIIMSGDIDSRASDTNGILHDAPALTNNASRYGRNYLRLPGIIVQNINLK